MVYSRDHAVGEGPLGAAYQSASWPSRQFWREESFDHVPRTVEKLSDVVEYIADNPVRAGLVEKPEDYRWTWIGNMPPA